MSRRYTNALLTIWKALPNPVHIAVPQSRESHLRKMLSKEKVALADRHPDMRYYKFVFHYSVEREALEISLKEINR